MSLLWTQAMSWYDDNREDEHEGANGDHGFRDQRPYAQRRPDLVKHIAFVHDVPEHVAGRALGVVEKGVKSGHLGSVTDYGLVLQPGRHSDMDSFGKAKAPLLDARTWKTLGRKEDVPTTGLHAIQTWVRHEGVAHNLFHPGMRSPDEEGVEGDPDYDPEWDEDRHAEWDADTEAHRQSPDYDPSRDFDSSSTHIYRDKKGRHWVIDGHHRAAAHAVLGKPVPATVVDHKDLGV